MSCLSRAPRLPFAEAALTPSGGDEEAPSDAVGWLRMQPSAMNRRPDAGMPRGCVHFLRSTLGPAEWSVMRGGRCHTLRAPPALSNED